VHHRLDGSSVVDEVLGLQLVQGFGQLTGHFFVGGQLALEFSA
jgi:hypothetical protein